MAREIPAGGGRLVLVHGDITRQQADAIVNAANSRLAGGGGVDGAIHRAGGPSIMRECDAVRDRDGGCPTGSAVATGAGDLAARHVIHAVGPVWRGGDGGERDLLAGAYRRSLEVARELGDTTVAFPSISTGVYAYPIEKAARVALATVRDVMEATGAFDEVRFVLFTAQDLAVYEGALDALAGE
jgi:O-acetyl-ADP-ribose deacetylase (regulator of RNase III)